MLIKSIFKSLIVAIASVSLLSCAQGESESPIAKTITLKVSSNAVVLPTELDPIDDATCMENTVTGPRVRLRASISWAGYFNEANELLIPLTLSMIIDKGGPMGETEFTSTIGSSGNTESISFMFGSEDDFIPADPSEVFASTTCFFDYGSLPKPVIKLTGNTQLYVSARLRLMGIVRRADGSELPFIKETSTRILYMPGSIPTSSN